MKKLECFEFLLLLKTIFVDMKIDLKLIKLGLKLRVKEREFAVDIWANLKVGGLRTGRVGWAT